MEIGAHCNIDQKAKRTGKPYNNKWIKNIVEIEIKYNHLK